MPHTSVWFFAATCFIYLSVNFSTVSGKCRGRWSIHACLGGNGKRSGPPVSLPNNEENNGLLLKRLLLRSADSDSNNYNDIDSYYPQEVENNEAEEVPVLLDSNPDLSVQQLQNVANIVQELLYRKKLRTLNDDAGLV